MFILNVFFIVVIHYCILVYVFEVFPPKEDEILRWNIEIFWRVCINTILNL